MTHSIFCRKCGDQTPITMNIKARIPIRWWGDWFATKPIVYCPRCGEMLPRCYHEKDGVKTRVMKTCDIFTSEARNTDEGWRGGRQISDFTCKWCDSGNFPPSSLQGKVTKFLIRCSECKDKHQISCVLGARFSDDIRSWWGHIYCPRCGNRLSEKLSLPPKLSRGEYRFIRGYQPREE